MRSMTGLGRGRWVCSAVVVGREEVNRKSVALSCDGGGASITEGKTGSVYCGHSRLLEWRLVIESIADEVAGGARSSGRAVVRFARV
ncbi:hypothetical protein M0R45_022655 [Rubus argutus]|uniref:Uncharacterized protein n=1 Tax=Rubus argutus TaxID=59490 RepID=A0AAW1XH16_RUBAR